MPVGARFAAAVLALWSFEAFPAFADITGSGSPKAPAGLWIGDVTLNQVAEINTQNNPTATGDTLSFRVLLHVDATGKTRLLKDVTMATIMVTNSTGVVSTASVLATDARLSRLRPVEDSGHPLVKRFGTVAYDWSTNAANAFQLPMSGKLAPNSACSVALSIANTAPTNPFRHPFHPDHLVGIPYTRTLTIRLPKNDPANPQNDGVSHLAGTYEETITGLVKVDPNTGSTANLLRARGGHPPDPRQFDCCAR